MTPEQFQNMLRTKQNELKKLITRTLPVKVGNEAVNHFRDNFRKEGFVNNGLKPWKPSKRKSNPKHPDRAYNTLMSRRNNLYRSIRKKVEIASVTIYTNVPYAAAHNEGTNNAGRGHKTRIPKRQFMGQSKELDDKAQKIIREELEKLMNDN